MSSHVEYLEKGDFEDAIYRGWNGPGWYFWDEADGQFCYGPYESNAKAELMLEKYCKEDLFEEDLVIGHKLKSYCTHNKHPLQRNW